MENYLQTLWGDSFENVTSEKVKSIISDLKNSDDEHELFWVSVILNDENILEINKNLKVIGIFEDDPEKQYILQLKTWKEAEQLFELLLNENIERLKKHFT